jgi:hypothetical protein
MTRIGKQDYSENMDSVNSRKPRQTEQHQEEHSVAYFPAQSDFSRFQLLLGTRGLGDPSEDSGCKPLGQCRTQLIRQGVS